MNHDMVWKCWCVKWEGLPATAAASHLSPIYIDIQYSSPHATASSPLFRQFRHTEKTKVQIGHAKASTRISQGSGRTICKVEASTIIRKMLGPVRWYARSTIPRVPAFFLWNRNPAIWTDNVVLYVSGIWPPTLTKCSPLLEFNIV